MKTRQSSCYAVTDATGRIATYHDEEQRYSFDPWGRRRNSLSWEYEGTPTSFLFDRGYTGHEHLDAFGLINMNGRVYDPVIARFLSADPIIQLKGNSQTLNRYSYCLNNPLLLIDPSGYQVKWYDESGNPFVQWYGNIQGHASFCPGSGTHWSDEFRDPHGNFMLMSGQTFQTFYNFSGQEYKNYVVPFHDNLPRTSSPILSVKHKLGFWVDVNSHEGEKQWIGLKSKNNTLQQLNVTSNFIVIDEDYTIDEGFNLVASLFEAAGVSGDILESSKATFRLAKGSNGAISLKLYYSGWGGGSTARITTYKISPVGTSISNVAGYLTTGMAYYSLYKGDHQPITVVDATMGTMGILANIGSYFYGSQIPYVGELVSIYGAIRLTWDVFYNLGATLGPSTWYGEDDTHWFK